MPALYVYVTEAGLERYDCLSSCQITVKQLAQLQGGLDLNLLCLNVSCVPGAGFRDAMQSKRQRLDMNGTEPGENGRAPSAE